MRTGKMMKMFSVWVSEIAKKIFFAEPQGSLRPQVTGIPRAFTDGK
jgi:hypothetical protein